MKKILSIKEAISVADKLHSEGKKIVLVGGCFDILHIGHITFLEKARNEGDILFVQLEHDEKIKKIKGDNRPVNTQEDRAKILASLAVVDYVIVLPPVWENKAYDDLVIALKPAIIATTAGDPFRFHKERSAGLIQAKVIDVTIPISDQSTTKLVKILDEL